MIFLGRESERPQLQLAWLPCCFWVWGEGQSNNNGNSDDNNNSNNKKKKDYYCLLIIYTFSSLGYN